MKYCSIDVYWYTVSQLTLNIYIDILTTHAIIKLNESIIYNEFNVLFYKNQIKKWLDCAHVCFLKKKSNKMSRLLIKIKKLWHFF